jgi:PleD family two-component response regulator
MDSSDSLSLTTLLKIVFIGKLLGTHLLQSFVSNYENENITIQQQLLEKSQLPQELHHKQHKNLQNILLVDDEQDIILSYKSILIEEGYNVNAYIGRSIKALCSIRSSLL